FGHYDIVNYLSHVLFFVDRYGIEENPIIDPESIVDFMPSAVYHLNIATRIPLLPLVESLYDPVVILDHRVRSDAELLDVGRGNPHSEAQFKNIPMTFGDNLGHGPHQRSFPILHDLLALDGQTRLVVVSRALAPLARQSGPGRAWDHPPRSLVEAYQVVGEFIESAAEEPVSLRLSRRGDELIIPQRQRDVEVLEPADLGSRFFALELHLHRQSRRRFIVREPFHVRKQPGGDFARQRIEIGDDRRLIFQVYQLPGSIDFQIEVGAISFLHDDDCIL